MFNDCYVNVEPLFVPHFPLCNVQLEKKGQKEVGINVCILCKKKCAKLQIRDEKMESQETYFLPFFFHHRFSSQGRYSSIFLHLLAFTSTRWQSSTSRIFMDFSTVRTCIMNLRSYQMNNFGQKYCEVGFLYKHLIEFYKLFLVTLCKFHNSKKCL